jgi:two-component system nitrate/nitrite response regulator NarL
VAAGRAEVSIVILGADPLARAGLASQLGREPGVRVLAELDPVEMRALPSHARVVVWDSGAAPGAMPEALEAEVRVPVLALATGAELVAELLAAGCRGVVGRQASGARLAAAIQAVALGLVVVDATFAEAIVPARSSSPHPVAEPLTTRESEVLQLLVRGFTNKQIASALRISEHTAKFHVNSILAKLNARGRTDAVVRAARLGLVVL